MALDAKHTDKLREIATARGVTLTEYKDELLSEQATALRDQACHEWWNRLTLEQREEVKEKSGITPETP